MAASAGSTPLLSRARIIHTEPSLLDDNTPLTAAARASPRSATSSHRLKAHHSKPECKYFAPVGRRRSGGTRCHGTQQQRAAPPDGNPTLPLGSRPQVVVTRERGKNGKLMEALAKAGVSCMELPLIQHSDGPDVHLLPAVLREGGFEWIVVTSPEAAAVFLHGWREAGQPRVQVAAVGGGTAQALTETGASFSPSKANAKALAAELPRNPHGSGLVLYPASSKAGTDLEEGLSARGFRVRRLNTYSTDSVTGVSDAVCKAAAAAPVAAFASPTAVKAWMEVVVRREGWDGAAACIGGTSAEAARGVGLSRVFFPDSPGIDGWVSSIMDALESMQVQAVE